MGGSELYCKSAGNCKREPCKELWQGHLGVLGSPDVLLKNQRDKSFRLPTLLTYLWSMSRTTLLMKDWSTDCIYTGQDIIRASASIHSGI